MMSPMNEWIYKLTSWVAKTNLNINNEMAAPQPHKEEKNERLSKTEEIIQLLFVQKRK